MCRLRRRLATQMIKHVPPAEKVNNSSATEQKVGLERSCNKMTTVNASNVSVASNTTESCVIVDTFAFSHFSAAVAAVILVFLSLFEKRMSRRCCRGDNDCTRGRPGLLVPVNLLTAGRDRWAYAYALGASTNMCLLLFFNAFQDQASGFYVSSETTETSAWINQLIALACAVEVGLCFFPFLACLKTRYRLIGAPIGLGYSLVWLAVTVIDTVQCIGDRSAWDDSSTLSTVAPYMGLLWSLPVIVCLIILMVKFTILMVGSLKSWCKEGCGSLVDKESEKIAQDFDFLYVRTLLVKKEEPAKLPWYRRCCRRRPDDGFRFSARMTITMVVSLLCLYELAIYEIQAVSIGLEILRRVYQNATQNFLEINGQVVVGANTTSVDNVLFATQVSWIVSGVTAFLVHIVYVFIIMGAYRRHVRLLYRGDTSWMPASYQPSTAVSITAGMKYSGSQIAFILWGFIIQQLTFLVICAAVYICILFPDLMLRLLDYFGPVTAVSLTTLLVQRIMATVLFSQSKVNKKDKGLGGCHSAPPELDTNKATGPDSIPASDRQQESRLIRLDISRAFDRVWHRGLIAKLDAIGVKGSLLRWIKDYLSDRQLKVVISGKTSSSKAINAGVPQGSILDPLLFLIFIDDITEKLTNTAMLYTDDTSLMNIIRKRLERTSAAQSLNKDLQEIQKWAQEWNVLFGATKCKRLTVSNLKDVDVEGNHPVHNFMDTALSDVEEDRPLAIDNRRLYHITSYFLFFFNLMVGFFSSVWRLLLGGFMGAMLQARIF
ncbi:STRA6 [Branchiostoma lanceolatum]|uniref:STRA6 protein n=1 Tax=Branchiostoma lanceolatum TaxID=7740 RepID=A0A8J9Z6W1_BRALA|nr:STRA6 [Branchiostoma lanceolatum]